MKKLTAWCLILCCLLGTLAGCGEKEPPLPDAEVFAAFGIDGVFPSVKGKRLDVYVTGTYKMGLTFDGAFSKTDFEVLVEFAKAQGYVQSGGEPAQARVMENRGMEIYTADKDFGECRCFLTITRSLEGEAEQKVVWNMIVKELSVSDEGVEPAEPGSTDYRLPTNLRVEFSLGGVSQLAVKIGSSYYCERAGQAFFYRPQGDGYVEYRSTQDGFLQVREIGSRYAVEYLVFDMLLDAGDLNLVGMAETGSVEAFGKVLTVYEESHEGITDVVWYDRESRLLFYCSTQVDGFGRSVNEVVSWDETVSDFGGVKLPD